jgi:predicted permease
MNELRHTLRSLARRPGFTLVVVLTLGLGIGANTTLFDLLNLTAWRRPAIERPREVVSVHTRSYVEWIGAFGGTSWADYHDYRARSASFSGLAAETTADVGLDTGEVTELVNAGQVSSDYFEVLGVDARAGRVLAAGDGEGEAVVVLGHRLWERLFGARADALGAAVRLDGRPFTVVGVAADGFDGTLAGFRVDLWFPAEHAPGFRESLGERTRGATGILGRLRPGVGADQAQEELSLIAAGLDAEHPFPDDRPREVTVAPATLMHPLDRHNLLPTLRLLLAAVAVLLLITCANVGNLLLARTTGRSRELAVRAALGAGRRRLARELFGESLVLAAAGGLTGLVVALWSRRLVALSFGSDVDFAADMRLDYRVLGLNLLACGLCAVLCTVAPAWRTLRADLVTAIKSAPGAGSGRRWTAGDLLVVAQVALSMVLLVATALLARSMWNVWSADPGFDGDRLLAASVSLDRGQYEAEAGRALYRELVDRAEALPGVRSAGLALLVPPVLLDVTVDLELPERPDETRGARLNFVDAGFFETLGIPVLAGRLFDGRDAAGGRGVVVVSRSLAESLWPGEDPLGRTVLVNRFRPEDPGPEYEVVGVVGDTIQDSFRAASQPIVYFSAVQRHRPYLSLVLRGDGDPTAVVGPLREELRRLDPALTLERVRNHAQLRWEYLVLERIRTLNTAALGLLGLVLAVVGVASVLGYAVSRRRRELGIRIVLGARGGDVRRLVLARALTLALAGVVAGGVGALAAGRLLEGFLFGVGTADPGAFAAVASLLVAAALAAAWWPARRASAVDPLAALRQE